MSRISHPVLHFSPRPYVLFGTKYCLLLKFIFMLICFWNFIQCCTLIKNILLLETLEYLLMFWKKWKKEWGLFRLFRVTANKTGTKGLLQFSCVTMTLATLAYNLAQKMKLG